VSNSTFNNISAILMEDSRVPKCCIEYASPWARVELATKHDHDHDHPHKIMHCLIRLKAEHATLPEILQNHISNS
jgi:hypothetical protein